MSVIILGGNECMERQYKDLCKEYKCRAKVFIKPSGSLRNTPSNREHDLNAPSSLQNNIKHTLQQGA